MPRLGYSFRWIASAVVLGVVLVWAGAPATAQDNAVLVIGVIDAQKIYRDSKAMVGLQKQIDGKRATYKKELKAREDVLRAEEQELLKQRAVLSAEAFETKRKDLEGKIVGLQRDLQTSKADLDRRLKEGLSQVRKELVVVSSEIASKRGFALVVEKSAVVLVRPELEITREALALLDSRLPKVDLSNLQN